MNVSYLPIGSIVMIKGGAKKIMVAGYYGVDDTGYSCTYMGLPYPDGYIDADKILGFNQNDVQEIIFEGYKDAEQAQLFVQLDAYANGIGASNAQYSATVPYQQTVPVENNSDNQQNQ